MSDLKPTQIKLEFLGTNGINSFLPNTSSPRAVMDSNHISQTVSLLHPDEVVIKSGIEYELGKYIDDVKLDKDCIVKGVIPKYSSVTVTPTSTMFLEYEEDGYTYLDYADIDTYKSKHSSFGYYLYPTTEAIEASYNTVLPKGTILSKTASLGEQGDYRFGINANVALMSHPGVSEDAYVVSESFCKKARFTTMNKKIINLGRKDIPLNLYGTKDEYKVMPDIGEEVSQGGVLFGTRELVQGFEICDLSYSALQDLDFIFDTPIYVQPNSIVVDIEVIKGNYSGRSDLPRGVCEQLDKYADMLIVYYSSVSKRFDDITQERISKYGANAAYKLTRNLHIFITDIKTKLRAARDSRVKLTCRKLPIEQYRIEINTVTVMTPNRGFKLTDVHAAKGVIGLVLKDEDMPVDANGNRADVIADGFSTMSRMNIGRVYHQYLAATGRDNIRRLHNYITSTNLDIHSSEGLQYIRSYMVNLLSMIGPRLSSYVASCSEEELVEFYRESLAKDSLVHWYPTDNEINIVDVIDSIDKSIYKPDIGPVTYRDNYGRLVTTKENISISKLYIMVLEKIGTDYSAVNSAKINSFGFPVKGSNADKNQLPHSHNPVKILGETEARIVSSYAGDEVLADLLDVNLNILSHKKLIQHSLESNSAFDPNFDIDRAEIPLGNTRSLALFKHIINAYGYGYIYEKDEV